MGESTNICCVKCNSILDKAEFAGLEVDLCPKCGGLWLDRGEINRAAKLPPAELDRLRTLLTGSAGPPPIPTENKAPCPSCDGRLAEVMLGAVRVDYCDKCHGIFLDRGELEDAVAAARVSSRDTSSHDVITAAIDAAETARS